MPARSAYFMVEEGSEKCFQQDLLQHQVLRIVYNMNDKEVLHMADCRILVKNPEEQVVKDHALGTDLHEGALALVTKGEGLHSICAHCAGPGSIFTMEEKKKLRWSIALDVLGDDGSGLLPDPKNLASLSHFKDAKASMDLLMERMEAIRGENDFEKNFEARFVKTSEAVNTDMAAFKFLQILLITGVATFQVYNLSQFLHRSKFLTCCLPLQMARK